MDWMYEDLNLLNVDFVLVWYMVDFIFFIYFNNFVRYKYFIRIIIIIMI